jgi:enoyl-[acyl-carrier protein] reductase II
MKTRITTLFGIDYPIVQAGMVWCSGWRLASAVSNAGALGVIGAASMHPEVLREHIRKCRVATSRPFGVNVPLLYPEPETIFSVIIEEGVKIVVTSAGNPMKWTGLLKDKGITVVHVIANIKSALKCEEAGVDAIVAEGFEAGGHNGKEETTTLTLIPMIREATGLPLIAAGGIASGRAMLAAIILGAEGVQLGTKFIATEESSAHPLFKQKILDSRDGDTFLSLKKVIPVRLLRNKFFDDLRAMEESGASTEELVKFLGKGRSKRGMFEGDMDNGELEVGQVAAMIHAIRPAGEIVKELMDEFRQALSETDNFL